MPEVVLDIEYSMKWDAAVSFRRPCTLSHGLEDIILLQLVDLHSDRFSPLGLSILLVQFVRVL